VTFDRTGHGRQADLAGGHFDYPPEAFTNGTLGGVVVPCLSREQQVRFHRGMSRDRPTCTTSGCSKGCRTAPDQAGRSCCKRTVCG